MTQVEKTTDSVGDAHQPRHDMSTRDKIVSLAMAAIAERGYSAFSFRELAAELGIKSASIHYHFPTKAHLGVEVAKAYRERFARALDQCAEDGEGNALEALINLYRQEVTTSQRMTVCLMLAAETKNLPPDIQREMREFYQLNLLWIMSHLSIQGWDTEVAMSKAHQCFALLQGGLMGAKTLNNPDYFEQVISAIPALINAP